MDFIKLARSQQVLRQVARGKEKTALLGLVTKPLGWAAKKAITNPVGTAGTALSVYGAGSTVNAGVQRARAFNTGMHPEVLQYARNPI